MCRRRPVLTLALLTSLVAAAAAGAACPTIPCDCLGAAAAYRAVAVRQLRFGQGPGAASPVLGTIWGSLCAEKMSFSEHETDAGATDIDGDVHALTGSGRTAVTAHIGRQDPGQGVMVTGVVATGGGRVIGPVLAGAIDTTGGHPGVAACQQALTDTAAASQMLAALTPTQTLPEIIVRDFSDNVQIVAGPGINVIGVDGRIALTEGNLEFVLDPATDAVILNGKTLTMRRFGDVLVTGGDASKVILNFPGSGGPIAAKDSARIRPAILAPERIVRVGSHGSFAAVFGKRVILRGSTAAIDADVCPAASPSGAFVDAPVPF
jgi:hypothetical protein